MSKMQKPTESELEILKILWQQKEASVREVHDEISKTKDAGYTNTLKLMQIMHDKKLVSRDSSSKVHIYKATITQQQTQKQFLPKFIDTLFSGSPAQLVMQALGSHTPSTDEIKEIEALLTKLKKQ